MPGFAGVKYQRGRRFYGKLFKGTILPILKYLGKKGLKAGAEVATDFLSGENIKQSAKRRLTDAGMDVAEDTFKKIRTTMTGNGVRRRKRRCKIVKRVAKRRKKSATGKRKRVVKKRNSKRRKSNSKVTSLF